MGIVDTVRIRDITGSTGIYFTQRWVRVRETLSCLRDAVVLQLILYGDDLTKRDTLLVKDQFEWH
jgi:hypothetical protein